MSSQLTNLTRGDTLIIDGTVLADGVAVNITGGNILFTMRAGTDKTTSPVVKQVTAAITSAATGQYKITIPKEQTETFELKRYYADIEFTDSAGIRTTLWNDFINVTYDIT